MNSSYLVLFYCLFVGLFCSTVLSNTISFQKAVNVPNSVLTALDNSSNIYIAYTDPSYMYYGKLVNNNTLLLVQNSLSNCTVKIVDVQIINNTSVMLLNYRNCEYFTLWDNSNYSVSFNKTNSLLIEVDMAGGIVKKKNFEKYEATSIQITHTHYVVGGNHDNQTIFDNVVFNTSGSSQNALLFRLFRNNMTYDNGYNFYTPNLGLGISVHRVTEQNDTAYISGSLDGDVVVFGNVSYDIPTGIISMGINIGTSNITSILYQSDYNITWAASGSNFLISNNRYIGEYVWRMSDGLVIEKTGKIVAQNDLFTVSQNINGTHLYVGNNIVYTLPLNATVERIVSNDKTILLSGAGFVTVYNYNLTTIPPLITNNTTSPVFSPTFTNSTVTNSTFINGTVVINGTLIINGDLIIQNATILVIGSNSNIVVFGTVHLAGTIHVPFPTNITGLITAQAFLGNIDNITTFTETCLVGSTQVSDTSLSLLFTASFDCDNPNGSVSPELPGNFKLLVIIIPIIGGCAIIVAVLVILNIKYKVFRKFIRPWAERT